MNLDTLINELKLIEDTFRDNIITTNYKKTSDTEISWPSYKPGIFKSIYAKEYETIIRNRQYSFLLTEEKGCVQFFFSFDNNILKKAKMAYYPYPVELSESKEDFDNFINDTNDEILMEYYYDVWNIFNHTFELNLRDESLKQLVSESIAHGNDESAESLLLSKLDFKYKVTNTSHFRIDYDSDVKSHHKCEIQVGAVNNIRLPMNKVISPFLFFDFIFKNVLKETYDKLSSNQAYKTKLIIIKKSSVHVNPFQEDNLFIDHK